MMEPFSGEDVKNIQAVKTIMAKKASSGDAQAALAFASLLQAETERGKAVTASASEKSSPSIPSITTGGETETRTWRDIVKTPDNPDGLGYVESGYIGSDQGCPS
jgi:hypothetical protein